jgi:hypothetical protein
MDINYSSLINKLKKFYVGEIYESEFKAYFKQWAITNNIELPKHIKLLKDTAYNSMEDVIPIVHETKDEIYYYDSCSRYCYFDKSDEGIWFEYFNK